MKRELENLLKNQVENVLAAPLARKYKRERLEALKQWRQEHPGREDHESGLDHRTPFEFPAFLGSLQSISKKVGADIQHLHLISDEISANIPTWVLGTWQERVRQGPRQSGEPGQDYEPIAYLRGKDGITLKRRKLQELKERLIAAGNVEAVLFVTDNIDSGDTLRDFISAARAVGLPFKIAVLSHYSLLSNYSDIFEGMTPDVDVFFGESLPRSLKSGISAGQAVIGRHGLTGDGIRDEYRKPLLEDLVKRQAADFAGRLAIPKGNK